MSDAFIDLDLTNPINIVRVLAGDVDTANPILSDNMYQQMLDMYADKELSVAEWFAAIYACNIIAMQFAPDALRSRERVNAVEIEEYGKERYDSYRRACQWLRANPPIGSEAEGVVGFLIGGGCNNGLVCSGISIGWLNSALLTCWSLTWDNGYYRPCNDLRFIGTIQTNLCGTCGCGTGDCGCGC